MVIATNVWFGGNPPIGTVMHVQQSGDEQSVSGRVEGLTPEQCAWFNQCVEPKVEVLGAVYEVRMALDGRFQSTRRIQ